MRNNGEASYAFMMLMCYFSPTPPARHTPPPNLLSHLDRDRRSWRILSENNFEFLFVTQKTLAVCLILNSSPCLMPNKR